MPDKLSLYNGALYILGTRPLATLNDSVEPRRALDQHWTDARNHCLAQGQWKFALRTVKLDYNSSITPAFGFSRAFTKPSDFIRTTNFCYDEFLMMPIVAYTQEQGHWYCEVDEIYVTYVSNDAAYGLDYTLWTTTFTYFVEAYLAKRIRRRIMPSRDAEEIEVEYQEALDNALFKDAIESPTQYPPQGKWVQSRFRGQSGSRRFERSPQGPSS